MPQQNSHRGQDFFLTSLGFLSGAGTGLSIAALADGTEGAVIPIMGQMTVRMQNYALLCLAFAALGTNMGLRFSSATTNKLTIFIALITAYAGLSFADSATNAVSDPTNSLQVPSGVASPLVTASMVIFFALVGAALSSTPAQAQLRQPAVFVEGGREYTAVGSPLQAREPTRRESSVVDLPNFSRFRQVIGLFSPGRAAPAETGTINAVPAAVAAAGAGAAAGMRTPPRAKDAATTAIATGATVGALSTLRQRTPSGNRAAGGEAAPSGR